MICLLPKNLRSSIKNVLLTLSFSLLTITAFSHGDLSIRIEKKTQEILEHPNNPELYFERGLLYQQHVEYVKAYNDYSKSKDLGYTNKVLRYRMAELNYLTTDYQTALIEIKSYLEIDDKDVKAKKLEAQIYYELKNYKAALKSYQYVMNTMVDIRPEDVLEYCDIILAEDSKNYKAALNALASGLTALGENTLSLQLKKLDYLIASNRHDEVIKQYDYFILQYKRKEFWYYKKALYLVKINKPKAANIALKLATISIEQLDTKFKNMNSIIELKAQIQKLENSLNT
ncbi:tetratricopeptide repeat protein [Formosa algae]|uniref:Zn-dependent protease n=1 Tax=Formosa algae TaxID=225843 RepID=A0A9X0YL56_9FLAO|nr:hypothetical protein [Formosa algae]MBP1840624.1 putative Zn-dependent protease [Formosa algae]MDQ0335963.1 putative Zn-dependent protease [Formosa algae]OEI81143.1 hypothetical protein AST99_05655 [Formosa algae]